MISADIQFRLIEKRDNPALADIIRTVMAEYDCIGEGYSSMDREVDEMFESYTKPGHLYLVLEKNGKVIGGGGIGHLPGADEDICELKKMYFYKEARGLGMGKKLVENLLEKAAALGYKKCYLETVGRMQGANALYQKMGFEKLTGPLGNTGHQSCELQYLKKL